MLVPDGTSHMISPTYSILDTQILLPRTFTKLNKDQAGSAVASWMDHGLDPKITWMTIMGTPMTLETSMLPSGND